MTAPRRETDKEVATESKQAGTYQVVDGIDGTLHSLSISKDCRPDFQDILETLRSGRSYVLPTDAQPPMLHDVIDLTIALSAGQPKAKEVGLYEDKDKLVFIPGDSTTFSVIFPENVTIIAHSHPTTSREEFQFGSDKRENGKGSYKLEMVVNLEGHITYLINGKTFKNNTDALEGFDKIEKRRIKTFLRRHPNELPTGETKFAFNTMRCLNKKIGDITPESTPTFLPQTLDEKNISSSSTINIARELATKGRELPLLEMFCDFSLEQDEKQTAADVTTTTAERKVEITQSPTKPASTSRTPR